MPALAAKNKFLKCAPTSTRIQTKSLTNNDVKRLDSVRRLNSKRKQTQSIQTQTAIATILLDENFKRNDQGTQTDDRIDNQQNNSVNCLTSRFFRLFNGTINSVIKLFNYIE